MEENPNGFPSQQVPNSIFWKNGSFVDINGNPVDANSAEAHIAISHLTDSFLDWFFN